MGDWLYGIIIMLQRVTNRDITEKCITKGDIIAQWNADMILADESTLVQENSI